jgi:pantothenate synthetase
LAKLSVQKRFPHRIAADDAQTLCVIERVVDQLEVKVRLLAALLMSQSTNHP